MEDDFFMDDSPVQENPKATTNNKLNDEVDPLDAYMLEIDEQVQKLEEKDQETVAHVKQVRRAREEFEEKEKEEAKLNAASLVGDNESRSDSDEESENTTGIGKTGNFLTVEELIAFVQKKTSKKRDILQIDHSAMNYAAFRKKFYTETSEIAKMSSEEVLLYRKSMDNMKIRGLNCPRPIKNWYQCGLSTKVLEVITEQKYERPTPIQSQAIPAIMSGRDLIGIAKTGSGKTMAFVLPMLRHILDQPSLAIHDGPIALIMTPTRELAMQTYMECLKFTKILGLRVVCAYGGAPIKDQIADLKRGAEVVICTPGRMIDLLLANSGRVTNLKRVTYLVLDEADRMFDMGFGPQVLKIIGNIRPDKQTVLFSATFPKQMDALARKVLHRPIEIVVGGISTVCDDVEQIVEVVSEDEKFLRLLQVLGEWFESQTEQILIFVDRQDAADHLLRDLLKRGYPCLSLHGGKDQADRDSTISDFKLGNIPILVATSVAARGLDVKDLGLVINYECPNHMEDYVHRVGRTGRAGNKGTAITFITPEQDRFAPDICKALKMSNVEIPAELEALSESFLAKVRSGEAHSVGSGFGGKGLERIDEERAALRKSQKRSFGAPEDEEEEEEEPISLDKDAEKEDFKVKLMQEKEVSGFGTKPSTIMTKEKEKETLKQEQVPIQTNKPGQQQQISAIKMAQLAAAQISSKVAALNPKGKVASSDALSVINARFKPTPGSASVLGEIQTMYEPKAVGSGDEASQAPPPPPAIRGYCCEIDINDYPQMARWKITNRDTVSSIIEYSETSMIVRGLYFPPGKTPRDTERRLHLRIEGSTEISVEKARSEVHRILVEATMAAAERGSIDYARYNL